MPLTSEQEALLESYALPHSLTGEAWYEILRLRGERVRLATQVETVERERAEQWRLRREAEASLDTVKAALDATRQDVEIRDTRIEALLRAADVDTAEVQSLRTRAETAERDRDTAYYNNTLALESLRCILRALGLFDGARPCSPSELVTTVIVPVIGAMRASLATLQDAHDEVHRTTLARVQAECDALAAQLQWQPIAEAPVVHGFQAWVYEPGLGIVEGTYSEAFTPPQWCWHPQHGAYACRKVVPTHFYRMPRPPAPPASTFRPDREPQ